MSQLKLPPNFAFSSEPRRKGQRGSNSGAVGRRNWAGQGTLEDSADYACYEDNWFDLMRMGVMDVKGCCLVGPKEEQFKRGKIQLFVK